jgi:4-methylaminobutanoate oxidase (formaldehyde-forming)
MTQQTNVVIIGGGIWGLSAAYHLAKLGWKDVQVLERNSDIAAETTSQAAGLVGQIRSSAAMLKAIQYAVDLFSTTLKEAGFRQTGSLMVALTPERMSAYERLVERARQNGIEADFVSHTEMARLAPGLNVSKVEGGYFVPKDGYLDPQQCAYAYAATAKKLGVQIKTAISATGLTIKNDRIIGVETEGGFIAAERVVVTAGPWTRLLAKKIGLTVPTQPIRHQRVRTAPTGGIPEYHPVVRIPDLSCYIRPEQNGYLYGFFEPDPFSIDLESLPAEFRTAHLEPPVNVMAEARKRLAPFFPILNELEVVEYRQGMTTFAPDAAYLIGPAPGVEGLFLATGCAALGIAGSAAVGRWLAGWIIDGRPGEDLGAFALDRFGARAADREWVRREAESCYANYYRIRLE